ncbi:MAG: hypothetical protein HOI22_07110 [Tateyamaria sp.]|nr:hypothetical protein [Tateyamaria sp.]
MNADAITDIFEYTYLGELRLLSSAPVGSFEANIPRDVLMTKGTSQ